MKFRVSVGRRINMLIIFQALAMLLIIGMATYGMRQLVLDVNHIYRFQLLPVGDIADSLERAAQLQRIVHPTADKPHLSETEQILLLHQELQDFYSRYRVVWSDENKDTEDNKLFREDLKNAGELKLLEDEKVAFEKLQSSLQELDKHFNNGKIIDSKAHWESVVSVRESLATLLALNMEFAHASNDQIAARAQSARIAQIVIGLACVIFTVLLGIFVHQAIAPRIGRLVSKVSRFKEFGVNEKLIEDGRDEITVLANAIDAGFAAIVEREKERDHFLAIAAHELKTPITSIQGFSTLLLSEGLSPETRTRALEIIGKQSWRLSRLIESLFLMMRARNGNLKFKPAPLNLSTLMRKMVQEVQPFMPTQVFKLEKLDDCNILGDELLLGHAFWSLFTCASAFTTNGSAIELSLKKKDSMILVEVLINGAILVPEELDNLFTPFHTMEYEERTTSSARGAIGLYLSREIIRVHHGRLHFSSETRGTAFCVELPS